MSFCNKNKKGTFKHIFLLSLTLLLLFLFQPACVFLMDLGKGDRNPWKPSQEKHIAKNEDFVIPPKREPEPTPIDPFYSSGYRKRIAALIGINNYIKCQRLEGAVSDAHRLKNTLTKIGFNQFFELYNRDATRYNILNLLGEELPKSVNKEDLVVIYFAGHGQTETLPDGSKRGYIVPVDAEIESVFSSAISMRQLRDLANRSLAKHVLYVMDSCYSGLGLVRGESISPRTPGYIAKITKLRAVQMITAGMEGEQAVEKNGRGLFTSFFIRALEGEADLNTDGFVTVSELGAYLRPQVTIASDSKQTPQVGSLEGSGEIVFKTLR